MISVILILVVEVYQQSLLSNTEQGFIEGRTIRKVMGGGGVGKKKFMQGKMPRKKFMQRRR